jgi:hypothetical protein
MNDILRLDRNLTVKRLPDEFQGEEIIRLIVWELIYIRDQDEPAKTISDIMEGTQKQIIKLFNKNREWYARDKYECVLMRVGVGKH